MNNIKVIALMLLLTIALIGGGIWAATRPAAVAQVTADPGAKATLNKTNWDWGEIKMNGGLAIAEFEVKNEGQQPLKLYNGTTSCACTNARIEVNGKSSGYFGMHTKSKKIMEIKPGEMGKVVVEFDPAFHGPSGVGPIQRTVTIATNDTKQVEITLNLSGTVVK